VEEESRAPILKSIENEIDLAQLDTSLATQEASMVGEAA
jgi:hypothetical protein